MRGIKQEIQTLSKKFIKQVRKDAATVYSLVEGNVSEEYERDDDSFHRIRGLKWITELQSHGARLF